MYKKHSCIVNNNNNNNKSNISTFVDKDILLVSPVKSYSNAKLLKKDVFQDNKEQGGVYRWVNNLNGKTYVGSGLNLTKRLRSYYNDKELLRNPRPIHHALLKYGHNNFTLEILEYCPQDKLLEREQFYFDVLLPEYNILNHAYSLLGFKHSQETIEKLKDKIISPEHKEILSSIHKGKFVSEETRNKLASATASYRKENPLTLEALANIRGKTLAREGVSVSVFNTKTKEIKEFTNQTEAGEFIGVSRQAIYNAIKRSSLIKGIYIITKKESNKKNK
jgi:group I intron endonuclease